jgi:hypothetical protein
MKKYVYGCLLGGMFLFTSASGASAGQVTIINKTNTWNCYILADGYFVNLPTRMETPCALPGKTEWFHTSLSVGGVYAYCIYDGTRANPKACATFDSDYASHPASNQEFKIDGIWLPHRNFTVTATEFTDYTLSRPIKSDVKFKLSEN